MSRQGMDADTAETLAGVVRLLRRAAELVWAAVDAEEPARRRLINFADDVIATTNHAVAAAAQLHPSDLKGSNRSGHEAHRGRSSEARQIARRHDPAPRGQRI